MDIYDKAIAYLKEHPDQIQCAWGSPTITEGGCLFAYCTPDGRSFSDYRRGSDVTCGCLTQIRRYETYSVYGDDVFTQLIKDDKSIPQLPQDVRVEHLERFAYWQRRLDAKWPTRYKTLAAWAGSQLLESAAVS